MNLSNLLQTIYSESGQTPKNVGLFFATGGSATTFINTNWSLIDSPPDQDIFKNMYLFVVKDAVVATGESALEGKWSLISAYADSTYTGTMATLTQLVAANDQLMIAKQDTFPLAQVIFCVNKALTDLGDLPVAVDTTSLDTVAGQYEYDLPVAAKRGLKEVWYYYGSNWYPVPGWRIQMSEAGAVGKLYLPELPAECDLKLVYVGTHPSVSVYNDTISEYVHPKVAFWAAMAEILHWYNRLDGNQDAGSFTLWDETQCKTELAKALMSDPIQKPRKQTQWFSVNA